MAVTLSAAASGASEPAGAGRLDQGVACVVHPYSSGAHLPAAFARQGYRAVGLIPNQLLDIFHHERLRRSDFQDLLVEGTALDTVAARLAQAGTGVVIAGCETGVETADRLAAMLGLAGNDPGTSRTRRDKGLMMEALAAAGVPHTRSIRVSSMREAHRAAIELGGDAVVLKPPASSGNDSVHVCRGRSELELAWRACHGRADRLGQVCEELLIQEFLTGTQFTVNSVSVAVAGGPPFHYVCEVWRDRRSVTAAGRAVYDRTDLLAGDHEQALAAGRYVGRVLDALGVVHGPAHTELMLTDRGFVLIETGARLAGMASPAVSARATGHSQAQLAADAAVDPERFIAEHRRPYERRLAFTQLDLVSAGPGVVSATAEQELTALASVAGVIGDLSPGAPVSETVDLFSSPGHVFLVGSEMAVERDISAIRRMERCGMYLPRARAA